MATPSRWVNVAVAIQSALAASVAISGITKADPAVVTHAGAGPANGDYVLLKVQGMHQLDYRVFRVANQTATTFELEGEDSSAYDTFSSGTFEVITFGTSITTVLNSSASGGDFSDIDVTTIHDNVQKIIPGFAQAVNYAFTHLWDVADAGLIAFKQASDNASQLAIRFTWPNGPKLLFVGYIGATLVPTGNAGDRVETPSTVRMFGRPTAYAT